MAEESHKVVLNLYDLSRGFGRQFSATLLGKRIEGIWHTGIVVYGKEYYYGGGIQHSLSGNTPFGTPIRVIDLGVTHIPKDVFETYLMDISPRYTAETYSLLGHNCNNFSDEVAQFLVGSTIPDFILQLPNEASSSPIGRLMMPMIQNLETTLKSGAVPKLPQFRHIQPTRIPVSTPVLDSNVEESAGSDTRPSSGGGSSSSSKAITAQTVEQNTLENSTSPAVETAAGASGQQKLAGKTVAANPPRDARATIEDRISCEFASIMATGKFRASEAAAAAARRVMGRYKNTGSAASQQD